MSLFIGRDVVEKFGLDINGSSKTSEYNGRSQPLEDSVAGHYCATLSPDRCAGLLKLKKNSPAPPTSKMPPRPTSFCTEEQRIKACIDVGSFVFLFVVVRSVDSSSHTALPKPMCSILISVLCSRLPAMEASQSHLTRLGLSMTPQGEQPEAPTELQDQQWRCMR